MNLEFKYDLNFPGGESLEIFYKIIENVTKL